jgi:hypothetical protein
MATAVAHTGAVEKVEACSFLRAQCHVKSQSTAGRVFDHASETRVHEIVLYTLTQETEDYGLHLLTVEGSTMVGMFGATNQFTY